VQIDFDWSNTSLTAQQQTAQMAAWEKNIEGWWNDQYRVSKDWGEYIFDLVFDVTFEGYPTGVPGEPPLFNQEVEVHPGSGRADMENWYLGDNAQTNAHEFGHMLGLFDEYWGGGINTALKDPPDDDHLMGADPTSLAFGDGMKQSYYDFVLPWMAAIDPDDSQVYALIPEPATGLILLTGVVGMALVRRRNLNA